MSNKDPSPNVRTKFDLQERTARFGEEVIRFVGTLTRSTVNQPLVGQIVRSGTSVGANYMEADGADSRKDFQYKIALCRKEAKETMHWARMLAVANPGAKADCRRLWQEAHELALIFSAILAKRKG
jgi:four helix bundle protein